jgi:hypothetical protein
MARLQSERCHFEEDVMGFFHHVLTTSYFTFNGQFYGQTNDVAMGSALSLVIANFCMEDYSINQSIQFAMETESEGHLPSWT